MGENDGREVLVHDVDGGRQDDYSYPSAELEDLLAYLDKIADEEGARFTEVTHLQNEFRWWGIPMKHHGFVLRVEYQSTQYCEYLTLDFGRRGILWDTFDEYPDDPDGTFSSRNYAIDADPLVLRRYCLETKPFSVLDNHCQSWSNGLLRVLKVKDSVRRAGEPVPIRPPKQARSDWSSRGSCGGRGFCGKAIGCFRKARPSSCLLEP